MRRGATAIGHALWRPWLRRRLGRVSLETIEGVSLVILPEVFNPAVFRSGTLLAQAVMELDWPEGDRTEPEWGSSVVEHLPRVLDLGTGSGVGALFAARRGLRVVAVDVNPEAVRCARINALLHGLERRIDVRHGDLFAPVVGERFELVLFNPPYFRGRPRTALDAAWRSPDVLERFAIGLSTALALGGRALLVLSTDGACGALLEALDRQGFASEPMLSRRYGNEDLTTWSVGLRAEATVAKAVDRQRRARVRRAGRRRLWRSRTSS